LWCLSLSSHFFTLKLSLPPHLAQFDQPSSHSSSSHRIQETRFPTASPLASGWDRRSGLSIARLITIAQAVCSRNHDPSLWPTSARLLRLISSVSSVAQSLLTACFPAQRISLILLRVYFLLIVSWPALFPVRWSSRWQGTAQRSSMFSKASCRQSLRLFLRWKSLFLFPKCGLNFHFVRSSIH